MNKNFILITWFTALFSLVLAQDITWNLCEEINKELPLAIRVYQTETSLPMRAWYVKINIQQQWKMDVVKADNAEQRQTVSQFAKETQALVAINGGYFGVSQGKGISYSMIVRDGKVLVSNLGAFRRNNLTYFPTRGAFAVLSDQSFDVAWIYKVAEEHYAYSIPSPIREGFPQPQPNKDFPTTGKLWQAITAVGGGPVLISDNTVQVTWEQEVFFGSGIGLPEQRQPRTAIGYTHDNQLIFMVVDGRQATSLGASLFELADMMRGIGVVEALNLDGGGSSTLVIQQKLINSPQGATQERAVTSAVIIVPK